MSRQQLEEQIRMLQRQLELEMFDKPYPNQKDAANKILEKFQTTELRYCLLRANEQVGKTGTYHYLIQLMFENRLIDNAYIVCGSNEVELLNQCKNDINELHSDVCGYKDNIYVVFRQDFNKIIMNTRRSLICIDESHLVQGVDQTLNEFLGKHELSMSGTTPNMIINNVYMLSIDATPYAEESAMIWGPSGGKFKVTLEDGKGYFGVKEYYENGLINATLDLNKKSGKYNFMRLLQQFPQKYILVRFHSSNKQKKWFLKWAEEEGCDILYFTSHFQKRATQITVTKEDALEYNKNYHIHIPCLEEAPLKTTVVVIDGRLRCGKRVPKKHIGFVWESTGKGKTDVIRQSLLGRMCGYLADEDGVDDLYKVPVQNKPLIFIPENILKRQEKNKVIELSDLERSIYPSSDKTIIGPRLFNNSIPGSIQNKPIRNGVEVTQCVPIKFRLNTAQTSSLPIVSDREIKSWALDTLLYNKERLIIENMNLTDDQKGEILAGLDKLDKVEESCEGIHIRRYSGTSNQNMYKCHMEAESEGVVSREHISGCPFLTFCVVFPGFIKPESVVSPTVSGEVYAIFYTNAKGYNNVLDKLSRIAKVANTTHFTIQPTTELFDCQAGSVYGFSSKILLSSDYLFLEFNHFIEVSKKNIGVFGRRFTSLYDGEFIKLPRSVYGSGLEKMKEIFRYLESKHSVVISYEIKRRRIAAAYCDDIELKSISWELL